MLAIGSAAGAGADDETAWSKCQPGQWGDLEFLRTLVDFPEEHFPPDLTEVEDTVWHFEVAGMTELASLLESTGLQQSQIEELVQRSRASSGVVTKPTAKFILALTPEVRIKLYRLVAKSRKNPWYFTPYAYLQADWERILREADVSDATRRMAQKLAYRRGDIVLFSDKDVLMANIPSLLEQVSAAKMLTRYPAHYVQLRLRPDTNLAALRSYWFPPETGLFHEQSAVWEQLSSLKNTSTERTIDISMMLTPFARQRLYHYAKRDPDHGYGPNCFWTAGNFFHDVPDDAFLNTSILGSFLARRFDRVTESPRYGDVAIFVSSQGQPIHAAVYIADDILFTKNGRDYAIPWVLNSLEDLKVMYGRRSEVAVQYYRRHEFRQVQSMQPTALHIP